ncbi:Angiopoietin-related protein 1,Ficolin-1-A,Ryncolin-1,Fibrinogen C domain-containing protein 1,Tenascin-N,Angiopoietin-related protein 7,Angiopoietin-related protein 6,Ficolin-3,Fibrinogen C domain-containing protein 1-B,Fibroleukin,Fibrinogen-like protein 1,Ficolin-1,Ficolin-1-B,Angiopoietin-4,Tenascin-R,Ryncolin-2,Techylectin-5B,Fibrinogen C domain-containing protein 1-A,Microfibril-associated glycoprotein 4,Fibrinogen-like protein A,Ryncolin-3,Tenascin-X,Ficolin-2,Fibrinogen alpha chain,Tenascin,Angiopo|uniref:Fibrinogen C-terminal domain-containing protein n=1 Tax=Mytilus edulis TaxID=6550 RepID=A0A8S3UMX4_MYTED|nr:Angiopoietin-related protein 1,Ficolin-1-A,Ryncolin-1,Fibrinogen C domain-containing protein 1,Tenascin-N,Angiopoietin-related protein 7,Angiopoietin-related protein 6,Ficolin-3,Fibrinogen C domain-containing protein 1-B,Fibroleukin,Fibrinogen-like protein 1,Ficolin-1,Ficolin-1-B,Angiopoietin-4,Tenascin-R,Ryncolin-2,Techylectin-5B,Fibrinogen C domain-containing protein 1-A,Microfibril-associated glycoprotein 4,Fibrinogen-like protein A,Ryncolin-3,Tenascin-X,Ficolin-2,Fibrinogen alpha chain,Tenas
MCFNFQQCSVEEYVTSDGNALYDVGCKDIQRCNLNGFGRRQANTTTSIKRESGTVVFVLNAAIQDCFPYVTLLDVESRSCFITETKNLLGHHRWQHGCIDKTGINHATNGNNTNSKTTTISTLKTTANPTPSTTMSTLKMTAIPTAQSTTMSNKTMTTIVTRRTTTAQRLSSTIDTTTRLKSTTKNQATCTYVFNTKIFENLKYKSHGTKLPIQKSKDCSYLSGQPSGIYTIYPTGSCGMFVYCEMNSSITNSPLTVFQRREDGSVNFYRNWEAYKKGFGNPLGEFWLGNDNLHYLSTQANYRLIVILEDWENETRYAVYDSFRVGDENSFYFMTVQGYSGDAGDSMAVHNGHRFSTYDKDNDMDESMNCAKDYKGGWWYYSCFHANLNALYTGQLAPGTGQVVAWDQFRGSDYSLRRSVMMLEKSKLVIYLYVI